MNRCEDVTVPMFLLTATMIGGQEYCPSSACDAPAISNDHGTLTWEFEPRPKDLTAYENTRRGFEAVNRALKERVENARETQ